MERHRLDQVRSMGRVSERCRSLWERALGIEHRNHTLWLKHSEFEMNNKFINHARNVWNRAVTILPRVNLLLHKYIHMEEVIGNISGARNIFERWMTWPPDHQAWLSDVKFERARRIFENFVHCHPKFTAWIHYAKFEIKNGKRMFTMERWKNLAKMRNCSWPSPNLKSIARKSSVTYQVYLQIRA
ncbi:hypothetical protein ACB092_01G165900 [Castanea dentata]